MQVFPSRVWNPVEGEVKLKMPQLLLLNLFPFTLKIFPIVTTDKKNGKTENATVASPELVPIYPKDIPNCYN